MSSRLLLAALAACLALPWNASAQPQRAPHFESPIIHPDRTVTFNLRAPGAKKVDLSAQFLRGPQPLTADTNGVWSTTVGPVEPNLYPYHFVVDGVSVADPNNMHLFPNERFKSSLVDIPGQQPAIHAAQNVLHGEVCYDLTTT
jgi:enterochelin esterase family protein